MLELLKKSKPTQVNKAPADPAQNELKRVRKRVIMQASMTMLTLLLVAVITFGMTAAWYTNVVQTGSLIFEVEQLGENVDAVVSNTHFVAQPGDEGIISLEASNNGPNTVNITVSVSKSNLPEEMQQRLYFFVEQQDTANGETAQRTYLTASDSFTYTVFSGKDLTLTADYHNQSSIKWRWVYDVLGYYVLGQETNGSVQVQEYLRPIEYDYDQATFDADGNLLTVQGGTTLADFLTAISRTDGYPGVIQTQDKVGSFYRVSVDENGYGVYAYLCTYAEVEENTDFDTQLGQAALAGSPATYSARLTVLAEKMATEMITVANEEQLFAALADGNAYIRLSDDVTVSNSGIQISSGNQAFIDLNGNALTVSGSAAAFVLEEDASLTLSNGNLSGTGQAFRLSGSNLTLHKVNVTGYQNGIRIEDYTSNGQDSVVQLTDSNLDLSGHGILIFGNGLASEQTMQVFIDNCQLTSDGYVISGNGTVTGNGRWGTDVQVINSTLTQDTTNSQVYSAIFHPQYGTLNIQNSIVSGYTGIVIKGGNVTIADSKVYGVGTPLSEPVLTISGFSDTGDAVYIETGYGYEINVAIRDTHMESYYNQAYRVFEENAIVVSAALENNTYINELKENAVP